MWHNDALLKRQVTHADQDITGIESVTSSSTGGGAY